MAVGEASIIFLALMGFSSIVYFKANKLIGSILFLLISLTSLLLDDQANKYMSTLFVLSSLVLLTYSAITPTTQRATA